MRKKKIIGIILAAALVAAGLGSFAYANAGTVNEVSAMFSTQWYYDVPGDTFTNGEVDGHEGFFAQMENDPDGTGAVIGLTLTLATDTEFNFPQEENLVLSGPPTWEWDFGDVPEGLGPVAWVGFTGPTQPVVPLTPGFDASRSLSETEFSAPGTQTLTITLTPRQEQVVSEGWLHIGVGVHENDLVDAVIYPPTNGDEFEFDFSPDGHRLHIHPTGLEVDTTYTYYVTIEVTPKVPKVEFMPHVAITWWEPPSDSDTTPGDSLSYPVPDVGTWTWSAKPWNTEGSYEWDWKYHMVRGLQWHPCSREIPGIEDFYVKDMVIDFDRRPNHDKIDIKKATFRLPEGATYDLSVDDVRVCVDDISVLITIPAGSFVQGKGGDYIFKSPKGVEPKVEMKLNFDKGEWHLKVDKIDASAVDNCDGVDIYFAIGDTVAMEHVNMRVDRLSYSGPPPPCPVPVPNWGHAADPFGRPGDTLDVTLSGTYDGIQYCMGIDSFAGATAVSFGNGIKVNSFTVDSDTQITANITILTVAAGWGFSTDVTVTTPDGTGTLADAFVVESAPPCPVPVPDWGPPGDTLDVTLSGDYEGIQYCMSIDSFAGATAVSFGDGITVNSFTVDSDTQITANITIAGDAAWGDRDVSVTTPDGTGTLANGFWVEAPPQE